MLAMMSNRYWRRDLRKHICFSVVLEIFRNQTFRKTRIKVVSISFPFILVREKEIFSISCYKLTMENASANLLTTNFVCNPSYIMWSYFFPTINRLSMYTTTSRI